MVAFLFASGSVVLMSVGAVLYVTRGVWVN